jgi:uncharacterized protein (TIGR02145 family)
MPEFNKSRFARECIYILGKVLENFKYKYSTLLFTGGNRNNSDGTFNNVGTNGNYWTSSVNGTKSRNLNINSGGANLNNNNRANGFSVRCVKNLYYKEVQV